MCNIAGYTGNRPAAPILIDMMRRQEGFWSGYYTGIVTIHEGKLYSAKVLGDMDTLLRETNAAELPGNIGLIHGRTPSGGDERWSYPFISNDGKLGFVENGSLGTFDGRTDFVPIAEELKDKGYQFISETAGATGGYPFLSCGTSMHYSDIQCHMTEDNISRGMDPLEAMMTCLLQAPCEDVAACIHTDYPGEIFLARYNQPMNIARAEGETYIATSPTAFPDIPFYGVDLMPANAGVILTPDSVSVRNVLNPGVRVGVMDAGLYQRAYRATVELLKKAEAPVPFSDIFCCCAPLFEEGTLHQAGPAGYLVVDSLLKEGRIRIDTITVPGMTEGLTAPAFRIALKQ